MKIRTKAAGVAPFSAATLLMMLWFGAVAGQQPTESEVRQTTFTRPVSGAAVQQVRFSRQASQIGDAVEQNITLEMRLTMNLRQGNQIVGKNQNTVRTSQRRLMTTTAVDEGRMTAVKVHYASATKQVVTVDANQPAAEPAATPQPVQGKTYLCRREPSKNGELEITDPKGERPPTDEYEIVSQQMQMVGRPNPFGQFLAGRTVAIGEKLELPNEVAAQVFNIGERLGKVTKFTLTLQKVQSENGVACALFLASVEAASNDATQMRLEVDGPLLIEADTCRARQVALIGPIGMSDSRGTYSTAYQMIGTGRLTMNIASSFHDAQR